tara:strand:+ start:3057 stop:3923 length:867 start_codon:yes stop_codon:yes gene_type:complete
MNWLANRYNRKSSKELGWHPTWFGDNITDFNSQLVLKIKEFQEEHELAADGKVGPITFRRLLSERHRDPFTTRLCRHIIIDGEKHDIEWDVKINLIKPSAYKRCNSRTPSMIVTHWDATTSADNCKKVLEGRNISTHFCIDNNGIIHQFVDTKDIAWHAGNRVVNKKSIGVDFSNAYYTKYNKVYRSRLNLPPRPILEDSRVHGVLLKPHLGYYKVQIQAYKKLLEVLCEHYKIPAVAPVKENGELITTVHPPAKSGKFKGVVCHYHLTRGKIDCAGLKLTAILGELR